MTADGLSLSEGLQVAGFLVTGAAIVFASGRLAARFDVLTAEQKATKELVGVQLSAVEEKLDRAIVVQDEKVFDLRKEVDAVRNDRHNTLGQVMQHTGRLGEHEKQIVDLDHRVVAHGHAIAAIDSRVALVEARVNPREIR